jgi:hypothetical protein
MTAAAPILTDCSRLGVVIEVVGDNLKINAPKGALTPGFVTSLKARSLN